MRKNYDWHCKVCDAPNEASLQHCFICNAPAVLSPLHADILRRDQAGHPQPTQDLRDLKLEQALDRLPIWKRVLAYMCLAIGYLCAPAFKFLTFSVWAIWALVIGIPALIGYTWLTSDDSSENAQTKKD